MAAPLLIGCSGARDVPSLLQDAKGLPREVDLIEVRLDRFESPEDVDLDQLRRALGRPAVLTVRTRAEGGEYGRSAASRRGLLEAADRAGFDWIDLESDLAGEIPRGRAARILSWHGNTRGDGEEPVRELSRFDGDVIKVAAQVPDAATALCFVRSATAAGRALGRKVVAIAMGLEGRYLRPLAGKFEMPLLYAAIHPSRKTAAGQITVAEALSVHRAGGIRPDTEVFAVAGADVTRSLSPRAHNQVFWSLARNAVYVDLSAERFEHVAEVARELPLSGLSVTAPHKLAALQFAATAESPAREIGAANTLTRLEDGTFSAANTDAEGFLAALELARGDPAAVLELTLGRSAEALLRLDAEQAPPEGAPPLESALIYGSGGVARAIAWALLQRGVRIAITGRSPAGPTRLALTLGRGAEAISTTRARSLRFDLLVKAVADEAWDSLPVDPFDYSREGLAADVVITPLETNFLLAARRAGRVGIPGLLMFSEQAVWQAVRFTGEPPSVVRPAICAGIEAGIHLAGRRSAGDA